MTTLIEYTNVLYPPLLYNIFSANPSHCAISIILLFSSSALHLSYQQYQQPTTKKPTTRKPPYMYLQKKCDSRPSNQRLLTPASLFHRTSPLRILIRQHNATLMQPTRKSTKLLPLKILLPQRHGPLKTGGLSWPHPYRSRGLCLVFLLLRDLFVPSHVFFFLLLFSLFLEHVFFDWLVIAGLFSPLALSPPPACLCCSLFVLFFLSFFFSLTILTYCTRIDLHATCLPRQVAALSVLLPLIPNDIP